MIREKNNFNFFSIDLSKETIVFLVLLVMGVHLYREIYIGNVNLVLLLLLIAFLYSSSKEYNWQGSLWLAFAVLIKPFFILFGGFCFLWGRYKTALFSILFTLLGLLLPVIFIGPDKTLELSGAWVSIMQAHASIENSIVNPNTIYWYLHVIFTVIGLENIHFSFYAALMTSGGLFLLYHKFMLMQIRNFHSKYLPLKTKDNWTNKYFYF